MNDTNRVGSHCWWQTQDPFPTCTRIDTDSPKAEWRMGILRDWSTDNLYERNGPCPVGVVEDTETNQVHSVYVERISFAANPPEETNMMATIEAVERLETE